MIRGVRDEHQPRSHIDMDANPAPSLLHSAEVSTLLQIGFRLVKIGDRV